MDSEFETVRMTSDEIATIRTDARQVAIRAVRALEKALQDALQGESLRGMKNIGSWDAPFYAARIHGETNKKIRSPESAVCVDIHGKLVVTTWKDDRIKISPVVDSELCAEDVEAFCGTLAVVIPRHIVAAANTKKRYLRLAKLSNRLLFVLSEK